MRRKFRKVSNDRRNITTELRKNQNAMTAGNLRILGNIRNGPIKHAEMKEKFFKEYLRRTKKQFETKLRSGNIIRGINVRLA